MQSSKLIREGEALKRRFTVDEYYKMAEVGILNPNERVELVEGEIISMPPIGPAHASYVNTLTLLLARSISHYEWLSVQNPIRLSSLAERYPDIAILRYRNDRYIQAVPRPEDVLLIIEVSDTTLKSDRETKISEYSQAGIPEVWLIDVPHKHVEVYLEPQSGVYRKVGQYTLSQQLKASRAHFTLAVSELFFE